MTASQAAHFEKHPHFQSAVQLRRFDEAAKVAGLATPTLDHYIESLKVSLLFSQA